MKKSEIKLKFDLRVYFVEIKLKNIKGVINTSYLVTAT